MKNKNFISVLFFSVHRMSFFDLQRGLFFDVLSKIYFLAYCNETNCILSRNIHSFDILTHFLHEMLLYILKWHQRWIFYWNFPEKNWVWMLQTPLPPENTQQNSNLVCFLQSYTCFLELVKIWTIFIEK